MATFKGTAGGDDLVGTSGNDVFLLWQGGSDTVDGGGGNDLFRMGAALDGDYSAGLVFNADTITNIEVMGLAGGHSYNLTLNDGNIVAGEKLLVRADTLGNSDHLAFNGAAETDGKFYIIAGAGDDTLTGGARHDVFDLSLGGHDKASGGSGNDTFDMGGALTAGDILNGGGGTDTVVLDGDYSDGLILGPPRSSRSKCSASAPATTTISPALTPPWRSTRR